MSKHSLKNAVEALSEKVAALEAIEHRDPNLLGQYIDMILKERAIQKDLQEKTRKHYIAFCNFIDEIARTLDIMDRDWIEERDLAVLIKRLTEDLKIKLKDNKGVIR